VLLAIFETVKVYAPKSKFVGWMPTLMVPLMTVFILMDTYLFISGVLLADALVTHVHMALDVQGPTRGP
jgi:hypothetical protein